VLDVGKAIKAHTGAGESDSEDAVHLAVEKKKSVGPLALRGCLEIQRRRPGGDGAGPG